MQPLIYASSFVKKIIVYTFSHWFDWQKIESWIYHSGLQSEYYMNYRYTYCCASACWYLCISVCLCACGWCVFWEKSRIRNNISKMKNGIKVEHFAENNGRIAMCMFKCNQCWFLSVLIFIELCFAQQQTPSVGVWMHNHAMILINSMIGRWIINTLQKNAGIFVFMFYNTVLISTIFSRVIGFKNQCIHFQNIQTFEHLLYYYCIFLATHKLELDWYRKCKRKKNNYVTYSQLKMPTES